MAVHKLVLDDFVDADYSLFAIHCALEDYRLSLSYKLRFKHKFETHKRRY